MNMPATYTAAKLPYRYYLLDGVIHKPAINLFLLSNIPRPTGPNSITEYKPVLYTDPSTGVTVPITLAEMWRYLKKSTNKYGLDLANRSVIPLTDIVVHVNAGADNYRLNGWPKPPHDDWQYTEPTIPTDNVNFNFNPNP
jgi:hypothetical protein